MYPSQYASIRRQGRRGSSEIIKFPTLEVRNPNELSFASPVQVSKTKYLSYKNFQNIFSQKSVFTAGPVYKSSNELSTKDIEQKIKQINAAEIFEKEEQILESIVAEEVEAEINQLTDIAAAEIVAEEIAEDIADIIVEEIVAEEITEVMAEEIDQLTDIEAAEIVAREIAVEIVSLEVGILEVIDETEKIEGSGTVPNIDFGDIKEVVL